MVIGWIVIDNGLVLPVADIKMRDGRLHFVGRSSVPAGEHWYLTEGRHRYVLLDSVGAFVTAFTALFQPLDLDAGETAHVVLPIGIAGESWRPGPKICQAVERIKRAADGS